MSRPRSQILQQLSTDDVEALLEWFLESSAEGWRPVMESWTTKVSGRYVPFWFEALREKGDRLMREVVAWKKERA